MKGYHQRAVTALFDSNAGSPSSFGIRPVRPVYEDGRACVAKFPSVSVRAIWSRRAWVGVVAAALTAATMMVAGPRAGAVTSIAPGSPPATVGPVAVTNLRVGAGLSEATGLDDGCLAIPVSEADEEKDLNGDGDQTDTVLEIWNPSTGRMTNAGLAAGIVVPAGGGRAAFSAYEPFQGNQDLNGDGDAADSVAYIWDDATGRATNLGVAVSGLMVPLAGGEVAIQVSEAWSGNQDFDGDGDATGFVLFVWDPGKGLINLQPLPTTSMPSTAGASPSTPAGIPASGPWPAAWSTSGWHRAPSSRPSTVAGSPSSDSRPTSTATSTATVTRTTRWSRSGRPGRGLPSSAWPGRARRSRPTTPSPTAASPSWSLRPIRVAGTSTATVTAPTGSSICGDPGRE